jgi:hypothetical protein
VLRNLRGEGPLPACALPSYAPRMTARPIQDAYHGDPTLLVLAEAALERPALRTKLAGYVFDDPSTLPDSVFAWPEQRRFAVHSEVDTLASIVYRAKIASVPAHVDAALERAVRAWQIDPEVLRATARQAKVAEAPPEVQYAVPSQQRLPLGSMQQVKVAEEVLVRDGLAALPYDELVAGARKIASAAQEFDFLPSPELRRFAGAGACHIPTLREHLHGRAAYVKTAEARSAYDQLAHAVQRYEDFGTQHTYDKPALEKVAKALHDLDVKHDMVREYGPRVLDPMRVVFNSTFRTKEAAADGNTMTLGGQAVPFAALYRLKEADWRDLGLDDLAHLSAGRDSRNLEAQLRVLPRGMQSQVASAALSA